MKFFIDTANIDEIKEANRMGMVDGVTTNPSLIAKENRNFEEIIKEICEIVDGPHQRRGDQHRYRRHGKRGPSSCRHS